MWKRIKSHFHVANPEGISITEEPGLLKISRIITFLMISVMFLVYFWLSPGTYFVFLTNWGIFISGGYYVLAYLTSKRPHLRSVCCIALHAIWTIELALSVVFWTLIFPYKVDIEWNWITYLIAVPPHGMFVIGLGMELRYTYAVFKRGWVVLPIAIASLYSLVNVPYTLTVREIYPHVTYTNAWSYLVMFVLFAFLFIASELGYQMTKRRKEFFDSKTYDEKTLIDMNSD